MLLARYATVIATAVLVAGTAQATEPTVVELRAETQVQSAIVTIGDIAQISGGDVTFREQVARLDIADLKPRQQTLTISRRVIEYRLRLAGVNPGGVVIAGADRTIITLQRRAVIADEVVAAARAELTHWLPVPRETVAIDLARPVVVQLPEVPAGDPVKITAVPHAKPVGLGRVQMDTVISVGEEKLLSLGVDLEIKPIGSLTEPPGQGIGAIAPPTQPRVAPASPTLPPVIQASGTSPIPSPVTPANGPSPTPSPVTPISGTSPANSPTTLDIARPNSRYSTGNNTAANNPTAILIHQRQRVMMVVKMGNLNVTAVGEAQQEGRLGQSILVQNVESKKTITARVTGPGTVELDLEAHQP